MLTDFKKWTLLLCSISSILCLVAAFAPHWIYMQPESVAYGLYSACSGNTCAALNMTTLRTLEGCSNSDCAHPTQFHDRWWAVAAGAWMGVAWPFFAFLSVMIGFLRPIYKKGFYISVSLFVLLGLASLAMTVGVFGATFSFSSGDDVCSNANGCVYWGASAMVMFAALGSLGLAGICTIASWLVKKHRTAFLTAAMFLCLCTTCLSAGGACTGRWVIKLGQYENASPSSLLGTITQCAGTTCKKLDRDTTIATTNALIVSTGTLDLCTTSSGVKMPTASTLGSRMATVVAFHVIAVLMAVGAGIAVLPADPYSRTSFCFVLAHFVSILIGLSVYAHTFGSWIGCGQSYCTLLGSVQPTWACGWGVSFAVSVGAAFLSGVLVLAYTFDLLCGGTYTLHGDDSKMLGTLPGMYGGAGFNRVPPTADAASSGDKEAAADGADGAAVAIPTVVEQAEADVAAGKSRGPRGAALDDDDAAAAGQQEMAPVAAAAGSRRGSARDNVPLLADTDEVEYVDAAGNPLDALMREAIARQVELDAAATGLGTAGFGATGGIRYPPGFLIGVANPSGFGGVGIAGGAAGGSYAPGGTFIPTLQLQRSAVMTPSTARAHGRAVSSRPAQTAASSTTRSFSVSGGPTSPSALGISTPAAVAAGRMSSVAPQTEPAHNRNRGNEDRDYSPRAAASAAPMTTRAGAAGAAPGDAEAGAFPQDAPVAHSGAPSGAAGYSNPSAIPIVPPTKPSGKKAGAMPIPEVDATAPPQSARAPAQLPSAQATTVEAHAAAADGGGVFGTPTASGRGGGGAAAAGAGGSSVSPRDRSHVHVRPGQEEEEPPLPGSPDTSMRFSPRGQDAAPMASPPK